MDPIKTDRLILRNFEAGDAGGLFAYLHQPRASCFFSLRLETMAAAEAEAEKRSGSDEYLAVCLQETGEVIGDLFAVSEEDSVSVGWNFNSSFGGQGFALEAARALFDYLFDVKKARRLYAYVEDSNPSSQRLCEKLGMRKEGIFMEYVSFENDASGAPIYENTMQYAILAKEWR